MSGEQLRLFVAVELGDAALRALGQLQPALREHGLGLPALRWVRPEGVHLTLKFLGGVDSSRRPEIERALGEAVGGVAPHELALGRLGTFGSKGAPRVLWVDLDGDVDALRGLQLQVEERLAPLGFPAESRRFSPHLTLARVREGAEREVAGPIAQAIEGVGVPEGRIAVRELSLMRSQLQAGGAVYTRLAAFPLG